MRDPFGGKSAVPMSTSKTQRSECGGWGFGLGNNVSNTMRGVNAEADRLAAEMDANAGERCKNYAKLRQTSAYKLARAEAKRARKSGNRYDARTVTAEQDADVPVRKLDVVAYLDRFGMCAKPSTSKYVPSPLEQMIIRLRSMK